MSHFGPVFSEVIHEPNYVQELCAPIDRNPGFPIFYGLKVGGNSGPGAPASFPRSPCIEGLPPRRSGTVEANCGLHCDLEVCLARSYFGLRVGRFYLRSGAFGNRQAVAPMSMSAVGGKADVPRMSRKSLLLATRSRLHDGNLRFLDPLNAYSRPRLFSNSGIGCVETIFWRPRRNIDSCNWPLPQQ
jgi:hypothetical protein